MVIHYFAHSGARTRDCGALEGSTATLNTGVLHFAEAVIAATNQVECGLQGFSSSGVFGHNLMFSDLRISNIKEARIKRKQEKGGQQRRSCTVITATLCYLVLNVADGRKRATGFPYFYAIWVRGSWTF